MIHLRYVHLLLLIPIMAIVAASPGCGGGPAAKAPGKRHSSASDSEAPEAARVAISTSNRGTITGKVVYDGTPPTPKPIQMGANAAVCHSTVDAENKEQSWIVDPTSKGVQNAVIFLQPPLGKFFDLSADQQKPPPDVQIDQPFCAFRAHVFVMFPAFHDKATNAEKATGQKLIIINDAAFEHNYNLVPGSDLNTGSGSILKPGGKATVENLHPQTKPITMKCNIHSWMTAYGFLLEHPYAAITDKDGNFKLENVPVGVPLQVVAWHESPGFFLGGEDGTTMTLSDKQVLKTFQIK